MERQQKLEIANEIVKSTIAEKWDTDNWRYIDFVKGDRFLSAITDEERDGGEDGGINIDDMDVDELVDHALDQINSSGPLDFV